MMINWTVISGLTCRWTPLSPVPIPAALWLLTSAIGLLGWLRRKPVT